jgi:hypothetical protein
MLFLIRLLALFLIIWLVCRFFCLLGKKAVRDGHPDRQNAKRNRKSVDSVVIDKEKDKL